MPTTLGAWLDPMADKLLLTTMFVMLTLPGVGHVQRLPLWLTVLVLSRDIAIVLTVAIVNLAVRAAHVPAVAARQGGDRRLRGHRRRARCTRTTAASRPRSSRRAACTSSLSLTLASALEYVGVGRTGDRERFGLAECRTAPNQRHLMALAIAGVER